MHPAVYIIGFIVFAVLVVWLARGARDEPETDSQDGRPKQRWFPDGGGPTDGPGGFPY